MLVAINHTNVFHAYNDFVSAYLGSVMNTVKKMKWSREKKAERNYLLLIICVFVGSLAGTVYAEGCGVNIRYEGKGAGQVVFDGTLHTSKGFTCSDCHEQHGFSTALFEMKTGANVITMRKMQLGSSCGSCHDGKKAFSATDYLSCSNCHHK
jgi:c(7)-type cytochrome triheme protein